ncbi:hypothetical protein [Kitasatospora sp. NPDC004289]
MKKVLSGAVLALSAAVSIASPAMAEGTYGSHFGDTLAGSQNGAVNSNGAPLVDADLRCAVANATGVAGVWGNENVCNEAQVAQFQKGGVLGG